MRLPHGRDRCGDPGLRAAADAAAVGIPARIAVFWPEVTPLALLYPLTAWDIVADTVIESASSSARALGKRPAFFRQ